MNTDPLNPDLPAPMDGGADERELQEAENFMHDFDNARAGVAAPARPGSAAPFAVAAARALSGGVDEEQLARARNRVREKFTASGAKANSVAALEREPGTSSAEPEMPQRASIPLTSVLFARLLSRLGLGVLDVVVLLIAILIGSQVLVTLLKKNEVKPTDTAALKKDAAKKAEPAGEDKPAASEAPDPHWLDDLSAERSADELVSFIESHGKNQKVADLLAAAQDTARDVFIRRAVIDYLSWRVKDAAVTNDERKAVGTAMLKLVSDEQAPTLLKKSAIRTLGTVAALVVEIKQEALKSLSAIAERKDADAPLRAAALDALIKLDPVSTDKVIGVTAAEVDASIQEKAFASLRDTLAKSPDAAAHLADTTVGTLVAVLANEKTEIEVKVNAAEALAHAIRQGNSTARNAGLPVIIKTLAESAGVRPKVENGDMPQRPTVLVIGLCSAAEIMCDPELVPPLSKAYRDFYDEKNPLWYSDVRVAVLKAFRAYVMRISNGKGAPTNAELKAGTECVALLIHVLDEDPNSYCQREAMKGLKYLFSPIFKAQQRDAIEAMLYLMRGKKTNEMVKEDAAETLQLITSMDFGDDVNRWSKWFDKNYPPIKK